jgi:hypothetical protein
MLGGVLSVVALCLIGAFWQGESIPQVPAEVVKKDLPDRREFQEAKKAACPLATRRWSRNCRRSS